VLTVGAGAKYAVPASPGPCVMLVIGGGGMVGGEEVGAPTRPLVIST